MTQEDKELLFKDLSARLPYKVKVDVNFYKTTKELSCDLLQDLMLEEKALRPYLRPLSSMTREELNECIGFSRTIKIPNVRNWFEFVITNPAFTDWLNAHHFDHRGLIEKGLALEAPEGMYK